VSSSYSGGSIVLSPGSIRAGITNNLGGQKWWPAGGQFSCPLTARDALSSRPWVLQFPNVGYRQGNGCGSCVAYQKKTWCCAGKGTGGLKLPEPDLRVPERSKAKAGWRWCDGRGLHLGRRPRCGTNLPFDHDHPGSRAGPCARTCSSLPRTLGNRNGLR